MQCRLGTASIGLTSTGLKDNKKYRKGRTCILLSGEEQQRDGNHYYSCLDRPWLLACGSRVRDRSVPERQT